VAAAMFAVVAAAAAPAAESAEKYYSLGLAEFHAGRYPTALQLFERAVRAAPRDPYARYYLGVTNARLRTFDAAVDHLKVALRVKPDFPAAKLELGAALVEAGRYREAVQPLQEAQAHEELEAHASLFLGLAHLRLQEFDRANENFIRAGDRDPALWVPASYYRGIVDYQQGRVSEASAHFEVVVNERPDSEMGREAAAFLTKIRTGGRKRYQLYATAGLQYDSNVSLAPDEEIIDIGTGESISEEADGRASISVGGVYAPWRTEHTELSVGYEFFQTLYFEETEFNLQDHRATVQFWGNWRQLDLGVLGYYDYYFLDLDSFLQEGTVLPWVTFSWGAAGETELFYRMRVHDFFGMDLSRLRNGFNHATGIHQQIPIGGPRRYVVFGFEYQHEDPDNSDGQVFGYDALQGDAGISWTFPWDIATDLVYAFRHQQYISESADLEDPLGLTRRDELHRVIFSATKRLNEYLSLSVGYFGSFSDSNKSSFEYQRHLASVETRMRF
jgi:tetratricopeptide (TPR) repeat protein